MAVTSGRGFRLGRSNAYWGDCTGFLTVPPDVPNDK